MGVKTGAKLKLVFSEEKRPYLLDISSLLYDFELLHDFFLILCAEDYSDYKFSRYFWYRRGRPLKENHKIRAVKIIKESPLIVELVLTGVVAVPTALWLMVQVFDRISTGKLNREKIKTETEKLKIEKEIRRIELEQKVQQREASVILNSLFRRFEGNPIKLEDIEIQVEESDADEEKVYFT